MRKTTACAGFFALSLAAAMPALNVAMAEGETTDINTEAGSAWDQVEGNWVEFKGLVKERWGELTDDDLMQIQGERQQLVGRIQQTYGISLDEADAQVREWETSVVKP